MIPCLDMVGLILVVLAQPANPYLDAARAAQRAFDFPKCLKSADLAARLETTPARKAEVELLWGLCAFELGRRAEALERFELALRLDPEVQLPTVVSPKIAAGFEAVRKRVPAPSPATEPVPPPPVPAPTVAPPAAVTAGPAASDEPPRRSAVAAITFSALALAAATAAIVTGQVAVGASARAREATLGFDIGVANQSARTFALTSNLLTLAAGLLAVPAVIAWVARWW
ncbi:MAG: tetratricopeptide repeat protein [Myxococcaceae bacterium]|nr:tetratricopeptide repeat protein [Myxococcaceae bacterium]